MTIERSGLASGIVGGSLASLGLPLIAHGEPTNLTWLLVCIHAVTAIAWLCASHLRLKQQLDGAHRLTDELKKLGQPATLSYRTESVEVIVTPVRESVQRSDLE